MEWILTLPLIVAQAAADTHATGTAVDPATAAATAAAATAAGAGFSGLMKLLIAIGVLVGSYAVGHLLARALKMPDLSGKLGLIMVTALGSLAICYFGWPPKLGIDLSGGVVLIYEIEGGAIEAGRLEDLADNAAVRLNQGRKEKITAQVVDGKIEFTLPTDAEPSNVESQVTRLRGADINLSPVSRHETQGKTVLVFSPDQGGQKVDMEQLIGAINKRINPGGVKEVTVRRYGQDALEIIIPEVEQSDVDQVKDIIRRQGALEFRILANRRTPDHKSRIERAEASPAAEVVDTGPDGRKVVAKWVAAGSDVDARENNVVRQSRDGKSTEFLVLMDPFDVTGQYLRRASEGVGSAGDKAIDFLFDSQGSQRFGALTGKNVPDPNTGVEQRLGIVLDNTLISAPNLKSQIREQGQITGINNEREIKTIIDVLNAGSLPTALNKTPIQEQRISAQLGADTIRQGSIAMLFASAVVLVFMVLYYRFSGFVADGAVILNLVLVIALMILIKAAFTLPGLAGLVLTIGMAVDANVLIYERMREEQQRGASLRMTIRNGFSRAMSTIIDSNVTTIATGVVLYAIGTDQIKGFAVTLILGLLVSMYTAVYVARVVFDISERKRWLTKLNMLQWFKASNIDFVGYMKPASILSSIVIGAGMIGVIARGKDLLDIDFTGGSAVQVAFHEDKPQDVAKVRDAVAELPDVTVSTIGTNNLEFKIDTSERDLNIVRKQLKKSFGNDLLTYSMSFGEMKPYQLEKLAPAAESEKAGATQAEAEPGQAPKEKPTADEPKPDEPKTEEPNADETKA
jgi:SecD/SecF fusion protein